MVDIGTTQVPSSRTPECLLLPCCNRSQDDSRQKCFLPGVLARRSSTSNSAVDSDARCWNSSGLFRSLVPLPLTWVKVKSYWLQQTSGQARLCCATQNPASEAINFSYVNGSRTKLRDKLEELNTEHLNQQQNLMLSCAGQALRVKSNQLRICSSLPTAEC